MTPVFARFAFAVFFFFSFVSAVLSSQVYISPFGFDFPSGGNKTNPFATLEYALDHITSGDTVVVLSGIYTGSNNFPTISNLTVTITSDSPDNGPSTYIFDSQGTSSNSFTVSNGASVTFIGLTFRNYQVSYGYGQFYISGNATFDGCFFSGSSSAISATQGNLTVINSEFVGNNYAINVYSSNSGVVNVRQSNISGPGAYGVSISSPTVKFTGQNLSIDNVGVGLYTVSNIGSFSVELDSTTISNCSSNGIYLSDAGGNGGNGRLMMRDTTLSNNIGNSDGAGIYIGSYVSLLMQSCSLIGNEVAQGSYGTGQGGGLYCDSLATVNLDGVVFAQNKADDGGAAWCSSSCSFLALDVESYNNTESKNTGPCQGIEKNC